MRCFVSLTLLLSLATASASAQERRSDIPLISVVGNGEARVAPDVATIRIGVTAQEPAAAAAQEAANVVAQKLLALLYSCQAHGTHFSH